MEIMNLAEREQKERIASVFMDAQEIVVSDNESYEMAGELARRIKQMQTTVNDYWEEVRKPAKAAYDAVLARKKEMLSPLQNAEKEIKSKMVGYQRAIEEKARQKELEMRRAAEAEQARLMAEAEAMRKGGDELGAEMTEMEADMMGASAQTITAVRENPTVAGVSKRKDWEIVEIVPEAVPTEAMGVVIRPVDEKAIKRLIKMSGGTVRIPGVTYRETVNITVRR